MAVCEVISGVKKKTKILILFHWHYSGFVYWKSSRKEEPAVGIHLEWHGLVEGMPEIQSNIVLNVHGK